MSDECRELQKEFFADPLLGLPKDGIFFSACDTMSDFDVYRSYCDVPSVTENFKKQCGALKDRLVEDATGDQKAFIYETAVTKDFDIATQIPVWSVQQIAEPVSVTSPYTSLWGNVLPVFTTTNNASGVSDSLTNMVILSTDATTGLPSGLLTSSTFGNSWNLKVIDNIASVVWMTMSGNGQVI